MTDKIYQEYAMGFFFGFEAPEGFWERYEKTLADESEFEEINALPTMEVPKSETP